jgi:hypothetical protein
MLLLLLLLLLLPSTSIADVTRAKRAVAYGR